MASQYRALRALHASRTAGVGRPTLATARATIAVWSQTAAMAVASIGSTNPLAFPIATTFLTQNRSNRPDRNRTTRVSVSFGLTRRNSASAASSLRRSPSRTRTPG